MTYGAVYAVRCLWLQKRRPQPESRVTERQILCCLFVGESTLGWCPTALSRIFKAEDGKCTFSPCRVTTETHVGPQIHVRAAAQNRRVVAGQLLQSQTAGGSPWTPAKRPSKIK